MICIMLYIVVKDASLSSCTTKGEWCVIDWQLLLYPLKIDIKNFSMWKLLRITSMHHTMTILDDLMDKVENPRHICQMLVTF